MDNTVARYLAGIPNETLRYHLKRILDPIADRLSSVVFTSAGLAIKATASPTVKASNAFYAFVRGTPVKVAANTDMAALSGTVTNGKHNVYAFYVDAAGNLSSQMGTEGSSFSTITFPTPPVGKAVIGYVYINPTGTGSFVGGTTALDDATVVPNATYINVMAGFDHTVRLE